MAPLRAARRAALLLAAAALLLPRHADAALSVDGKLAPGANGYAPTYPSVLLASNGFTYTPGVVNTTLYTASNTTGQGYANASVILDWNEAVQKSIIAGSPVAPASGKVFSGAFAEQPLSLVAASRLSALLNTVMYETVLLFGANASSSAVDPYNADGSCPARVLAANASAICPRYVSLKDLGNGVPALAASYAAHYLLTSLLPTKAGSGGSSLTNIRFDAVLKNHQQWYNLQWSKAENNPGWAIGYSSSAKANTSSACPNQLNFCSAASAAAINKTVTGASQNVGILVATAVMAARINDGYDTWTPLSLSLNDPHSVLLAAPAPGQSYQPTHNGNYAAAVAAPSSLVVPITTAGDNSTATNRVDGPRRSAYYSDAYLNFAPYGSASQPGVLPYSLAPQLAASKGFVVTPQADKYLSAAAALYVTPANASWAAELAAASAGALATNPAAYSDAQLSAFYWRLGGGSHGLSGHLNSIAAYLLNNATAKYSLLQTAQLHAQLHTAIYDAQAAAWRAKQFFLAERPETDLSASGPWQPLLANPPYPAFPSAHAATCSAAVAVLQNFFGGGDAIPTSGNAPLTVASTDSWQLGSGTGSSFALKPTSANTIVRSYTSFAALAGDCANSRVAGGVQYPSSAAAGAAVGAAVAQDVLATYPGQLGASMPAVWNFLSYVPAATVTSAAGARLGASAVALALAAAAAALL